MTTLSEPVREQAARRVPHRRRSRRRRVRTTISGVLLGLAALLVGAFAVFPFYWMVNTALKPDREIFTRTPLWWPQHLTFDQFEAALIGEGMGRYFLNTLIVAACTVVLSTIAAGLAALAVSRLRFRFRTSVLVLVLVVQMVPLEALVIPLFIMMNQAGLYNTLASLVIAYITFALPFAIWMLKGFYDAIPTELEDAAMVDGCTRVGAYWRILVPLVAPGLVATSIFAFIEAWNEFLLALTFLQDDDKFTLPIALNAFIGVEGQTQWGPLMAASAVFTLPVLVFFILVQKRLAGGLVQGAVKT
jgi:N,N'-diacetylchitobiose transport system permease protein